jgi:hypothetical protein
MALKFVGANWRIKGSSSQSYFWSYIDSMWCEAKTKSNFTVHNKLIIRVVRQAYTVLKRRSVDILDTKRAVNIDCKLDKFEMQ